MLIKSTKKTGMMNISKAMTIRNKNDHKRPFRPFANSRKSYGKDHREGLVASHKGNMAEERPVWLFIRKEHHGRRRLRACTGQH